MNTTIQILRGELEILYSLEELTKMSEQLLGVRAEDVGVASTKATFVEALARVCAEQDKLEALLDVLAASRQEVDPRARDIAGLLTKGELAPGRVFDGYHVERKLSGTELGTVYLAKKDGKAFTLKTLRPEATRDRRAVQRFLTANRLVARSQRFNVPPSSRKASVPSLKCTASTTCSNRP